MSSFAISKRIASARKPHQCYWCGERINVTTPYIKVSGSHEGSMGHTCWHPECDAAFHRLSIDEHAEIAVECLDAGMYQRGSTELKPL